MHLLNVSRAPEAGTNEMQQKSAFTSRALSVTEGRGLGGLEHLLLSCWTGGKVARVVFAQVLAARCPGPYPKVMRQGWARLSVIPALEMRASLLLQLSVLVVGDVCSPQSWLWFYG